MKKFEELTVADFEKQERLAEAVSDIEKLLYGTEFEVVWQEDDSLLLQISHEDNSIKVIELYPKMQVRILCDVILEEDKGLIYNCLRIMEGVE